MPASPVRQEDWERLLNDIKVVSKLSGMDKVISNVAPMVMGVGFLGGDNSIYGLLLLLLKIILTGMFVTSAMEKGHPVLRRIFSTSGPLLTTS